MKTKSYRANDTQIKIINTLHKHGAFSIKSISQMLHSSPNTVSPEIKFLIRIGMIKVVKRKGRRRYKLSISGKAIAKIIKNRKVYIRRAKKKIRESGKAITKRIVIHTILVIAITNYPFLQPIKPWLGEILDILIS